MKQLVDDFARYLDLPRLAGPEVLVQAMREGVALLTWQTDTFAYAEGFDEAAGRFRGLRAGQMVSVSPDSAALLVKSDVARRQLDIEVDPAPSVKLALPRAITASSPLMLRVLGVMPAESPTRSAPTWQGLVGADVRVTLEVDADIPSGAPDHVVRTVTENGKTFRFTSQEFEKE